VFVRKILRISPDVETADIENEIRAIKKLCSTGHQNIVQVHSYGAFSEPFHTSDYYIDMEYCDKTLDKYIRDLKTASSPVPTNQIFKDGVKICKDITKGLVFIHLKKEVHRDIKPQNGFILYKLY
jgi:serine/threonine protein kinase